MFARRTAIAAAAALAVSGLFIASAAPAFASGRVLPADDRMYILDCDEAGEVQGWSVDAPSAAVTQIGDGTNIVGEICAFQAAYDAVSGKSYYVDYRNVDGDFTTLNTFDPATGDSVEGPEFFEGDESNPFILSIAITSTGAAYAIDDSDNLFTLNLGTGEVKWVAEISTNGPFYAFAADPTTDLLYAISVVDDTVYLIDALTAAATPQYVLNTAPDDEFAFSLQIASDGVFWFINAPFEDEATLWSVAGVGTDLASGEFVDEEPTVYSQSLLIIPAPKLPATGPADASIALFAGLSVLLVGGALLMLRRRTA